jgi:hypothetical protein
MNNLMNEVEEVIMTSSPIEDIAITIPSPPVRPWVRYWARYLDTFLFTTLLATLWIIIDEKSYDQTSSLIFAVISTFLYIFVEGFFLWTWGTSIGKVFMKISLRNTDGSKLSGYQALKRSRLVWLRGMGIGVGIVELVANIIAFNTLKRDGITTWDHDMDLIVSHEKLGVFRIIMIVIVITMTLGFLILGVI